MNRPILSNVNSKVLTRIEKKIDSYKTLEKKMDYVDSLVIWYEFYQLKDGEEDIVEEYLREYV